MLHSCTFVLRLFLFVSVYTTVNLRQKCNGIIKVAIVDIHSVQMIVKQHILTRPCHYLLNPDQEPNLELSVADNFMESVIRFAKCPFMAYRAGLSTDARHIEDTYTTFTYEQSLVYITQIIRLLRSSDFKRGDRAAIYAKNSPLWLLSDIAVQILGGISVLIYDTLGVDNIKYCLELVEARVCFVSNDYVANVIRMWDRITCVKRVICFDRFDGEELKHEVHNCIAGTGSESGSAFSQRHEQIIDAKKELFATCDTTDIINGLNPNKIIDFLKLDVSIDNTAVEEAQKIIGDVRLDVGDIKSDSDSTVIFSSGTSNALGRPHAVIQSNKQVLLGIGSLGRQFYPYHISSRGVQSSFLSYLPLAHVFEHSLEVGMFMRGYLIYYYSGNIKNLTVDLALAKPSVLVGVPRVFQKVYDSVSSKLQRSSLIKRTIFNAAFKAKQLYISCHRGGLKDGRMPLVDVVFKRIQQALGGNVEFIGCGSSSLTDNVRQFLEVASGSKVVVGYGMAETSCGGCYCYPGQKYNMPGQLGFASYLISAKVIDRRDACEFSLEADKIGELQISGPMVSRGYVAGPWSNVTPITDGSGFYSTGDLVKLHDDGSVSFIRRIQLVVKLSQGEFVDLEQIERILESIPLINTAFVHAEAEKTAPIAFVNLDSSVLRETVGQDVVLLYLKNDEGAVQIVEKLVFQIGSDALRKYGLKGFNIPKAFKIYIDHDWSANANYYTPSLKKKHNCFIASHKQEIAALWSKKAVTD